MRKSLKKVLATGLAATMVLSMTACNNGGSNDTTTETTQKQPEETTTQGSSTTPSGTPRHITIGSWWVQYYDSTHTSVEDDPNYAGDLAAELKFENVKKIEDKYNVTFAWENLTYAGTKESINTSVLAGSPDCDI